MVKTEIKESMFYSVQVDDTTDISQRTQCSVIILRYITNKSELVERFLGFYNVSENRTAEGLFNTLNSVLLEFGMEKKLIGQCYDGVSVMAGHVNGLQVKVKEVSHNALFTHCLAHRLNLVLQHGCSANTQYRIFFANMNGISAFFHNSTSRTNVVDAIVGKRIPQFVQTRWTSRSIILNLVVDKWDEFKKVFEHIIKDSNSSSESICGSTGHLKNLKKFDLAFLAQTFNKLEVLYSDEKYQDLHHIYDLVKIFESSGLKVILPEVYKLFSLILTIPSTSVSVERSFSCLKRIKTYLRNNISRNRLSSLAIISIEKELVDQLKHTGAFYDEVINIYASKKNRSIGLRYKS
ncbi:zinc finger MYM-type protein 1-like [Myzus persicae]|uniref:zinc finger MYM-type protein 1-like n=1 Tax=Myzus persicae TaxID=13164 RepID=UPI000B933470|nr:zinc finger MYM-type protein 1-like [Myzus persicae]